MCCWKHNFWKKEGKFFQWRKDLASLSRNMECDKPQWTVFEGPKGILTVALEGKRSFLCKQEVVGIKIQKKM